MSVLIFEEYLQSEKTIEHYTYYINRFAKYFDLPSCDSILALKITYLKEKIVNDYVLIAIQLKLMKINSTLYSTIT